MKRLISTFLLVIYPALSFANSYVIEEGFYSGIDPTKLDENRGDIDKSVAVSEKPVDGKYYGYKFSDGGFFVAPEAIRRVSSDLNTKSSGNLQDAQNLSAEDNINYDIKANIGYEFNKNLSGFVTYDVGSASYNSLEKSAAVNIGQSSAIGVGSQIKLLDDFTMKVTYTQQQSESETAVNGGQIKDDIVRFGTSYSF